MLTINVLEYFERSLQSHPAKVMLNDSTQTLTFQQVADLAAVLAMAIIRCRDVKNGPIAVYLPRSNDVAIANVAVLMSGNFYMNIDTASPGARTRIILDNVQPQIVITSRKALSDPDDLGLKEGDILYIEDFEGTTLERQEGAELRARWTSLIDVDPICLINTSGSTGIPKATLITHRGIIDFVEWAIDRYALDSRHVVGNQSPFHFDIYLFELVMCMATGAALTILPAQLFPFPARLLEYMHKTGITFIFWVPTIMVNIANLDLLSHVSLPDLRRVWFAGEVFPTKSCNYWRRHLPHVDFTNLYGPIEITLDCTIFDIDRAFNDTEPLPIGRACRNTGILILNDRDEQAGPGEIGELCVRGTGLAAGYYNDFDRTRHSFCQNPLNTKYPDLIYRTGDLVSTNTSGEIIFLGRKDYQIKHQGNRIELGEIEHVAMECTWIRNCCVHYDQPNKAIVMFYESDASIPADVLRSELGKMLPRYMIPAVYKHLAHMPMNANGKIDRRGLLELMNHEAQNDSARF
jgi:D-alanine--poly(phosphoribitol) ligase subunit 1